MAGRLSDYAPGTRKDGKPGKEREIVVMGRKWCGTSGNELMMSVAEPLSALSYPPRHPRHEFIGKVVSRGLLSKQTSSWEVGWSGPEGSVHLKDRTCCPQWLSRLLKSRRRANVSAPLDNAPIALLGCFVWFCLAVHATDVISVK